MFKSVEYDGFNRESDLKATAERLTPVLANKINAWRDNVTVRWSPHRGGAGVLDLSLSLTLPNGVAGEHTGTFVSDDFTNTRWLAGRCNRVWSDLLGVLLDKQHKRVEEYLLDPVEA